MSRPNRFIELSNDNDVLPDPQELENHLENTETWDSFVENNNYRNVVNASQHENIANLPSFPERKFSIDEKIRKREDEIKLFLDLKEREIELLSSREAHNTVQSEIVKIDEQIKGLQDLKKKYLEQLKSNAKRVETQTSQLQRIQTLIENLEKKNNTSLIQFEK